MNVLMSADTVGGVFTYSVELIRALRPEGVHFVLLTMGGPLTLDQRSQLAVLPNVEVMETSLKLEWMQDCWDDVDRAGALLLSLAAERNIDLVHLNGYAHAALPWPCPVVVVAHSCVTSWWRACHREEAPPEWDLYRRRVQHGLKAAHTVVAPTHAYLADLRSLYELPPAQVVYNTAGVELEPHAPKQPLILSAGRLWDKAKNVALLREIHSQLEWPVAVAGPGDEENSPGYRTLGRLTPSQLYQWMRCAAVYASPALYEPFGLAILEAAHRSCALVLSNLPSLREIWGDAALYCSAYDPGDWIATLNRLAHQPQELSALQSRALQRAQRYSPSSMATEYLDVYQALLYSNSTSGRSMSCAS